MFPIPNNKNSIDEAINSGAVGLVSQVTIGPAMVA